MQINDLSCLSSVLYVYVCYVSCILSFIIYFFVDAVLLCYVKNK